MSIVSGYNVVKEAVDKAINSMVKFIKPGEADGSKITHDLMNRSGSRELRIKRMIYESPMIVRLPTPSQVKRVKIFQNIVSLDTFEDTGVDEDISKAMDDTGIMRDINMYVFNQWSGIGIPTHTEDHFITTDEDMNI